MTKAKHSSKPRRKPITLGTTPREVYLLAALIVEAGEHFEKERSRLTGEALTALEAAQKHFHALLVKDPSKAIREFSRIRRESLIVEGRIGKRDGVRDAALGRAVLHVYEWICRKQRGEHRGFAMPVAALGPISAARPVRTEQDIEKLLANGAVRKALNGNGAKKRGGPKDAAIALVALATGEGEQTVKRAAQFR